MLVVIAGCGRVGSELAKLLSNEGHDVVIIDKEAAAFARLGTTFNGMTVVGNGFDLDLLGQVGLGKADAFCAVTNGDNTNLIAAQVAKKIFKIKKVFARVYDPRRAHIYGVLGLDIISGTILFAAMLRDKIMESRFSSYLIETKDLGVLEIDATASGLAGRKIREINISGEFLICAIRKVDSVVIPDLETIVKPKDTLMAVVKVSSLEKVKETIKLKE